MEEIANKITQILVEKMGIADSEVTMDANFIKDLGIDSLDYAELVMEFEQSFDIRIPDSDAERMQTMKQAVEYISEKLAAKKNP
ncbi:acyl carrier protein [Peijinzhouia sedimentorum]|tara:strand:- start:284 stop:535 length:252 start_codon:yes stop_codon:yes gene_type:complete